MAIVDKNAALETALMQIEKQFGKGAVMRLGARTKRCTWRQSQQVPFPWILPWESAACRAAELLKSTEPESSGKTTLGICTVLQKARRMAETAAFIDVEHALGSSLCKRALGVDVDCPVWLPSRTPANRRWRLPKRWCAPVRLT